MERVNFIGFACDGETVLEIKPKAPFEDYVIRPQSLNFRSEKTEDGTIKVYMTKPAYFTVEPYGRHNALHIFADPMPQYNIAKTDDVIYFGPGEHDVGTLQLKDNQTVFIDEGAVVYACINAFEANNIKILGRGILDNSRNHAKILYEAQVENNTQAVNNAKRTNTIQLEDCNNIEIDGITIRDSLVYNIRPLGCENLSIKNIKIIGCWRFNSDGIDMHNCINVHIADCFIRTFDDSICVKGFDCYYDGDVEEVRKAMYWKGNSYDIFQDVLVENCVIWNDWGKCLEIGAETRAEEIYNIHYTNCDIIHVTGAVLSCCNVDYADVHDICYDNINVEYDDVLTGCVYQYTDDQVYASERDDCAPPLISTEIIYYPEYSTGGTRRGKIRNALFKNIHLFSKWAPYLTFGGYNEEHKSKDIVVEDLYWNEKKIESADEIAIYTNEFCENITLK